MKRQKEMYEAPTIQIVDVQMRGMLCESPVRMVLFYDMITGNPATGGLDRNNYGEGTW